MPRKSNPKSLRLGFTKVWDNVSQHYGQNLQIFIIFFYKYLISLNFISKKLIQNNILINNIEIWHTNFEIKIKIYLNSENITYYEISKNIIKVLTYWFYFNKFFRINFIYNKMNFYTVDLLKLYIDYLFTILNYTPKKIVAIISVLIANKLNKNKVTYSKMGPLNLYLKGYKIILNGRFDNSKSGMAKTLILQNGSLKLISLNNQIDFVSKNLHTKFGVCNLKLWLFYKII